MLRPETRTEIERLIAEFPEKRSAILPALKLVQHDAGYLRREEMEEVADIFDVSVNVLYQLASFYSMLHLKPRGEHHLELCDGLPCELAGAERLCRHIEARLGIKAGETTPDGKITFTRIECIGSCDRTIALLIDHLYVEDADEAKVDRLLDGLQRGEIPQDVLRDPELAETH